MRVITHAPPLIPPKRGEEDNRHKAVPAVYEKKPFFILKIMHLKNFTWANVRGILGWIFGILS